MTTIPQITNDGKPNADEHFRTGVDLICVIIFVISGLIVFHLPELENSSVSEATVVYDWLQRLPTEPVFYYLVALLIGVYLRLRWYEFGRLGKDCNSIEQKEPETSVQENRHRLTPRDWWTVRELRKRALQLRMRADMALAGVIVLLMGGIYAFLFIVPQIGPFDDSLIRKRERLLTFKVIYGNKLKLISEGRYWFNLSGVSNRKNLLIEMKKLETVDDRNRNQRLHIARENDWIDLSDAGITKRDEQIEAVIFHAEGKRGLVVGHKGSVFFTENAGKNWKLVGEIKPPSAEAEGFRQWAISPTFS